jgi:hypothetical protein
MGYFAPLHVANGTLLPCASFSHVSIKYEGLKRQVHY